MGEREDSQTFGGYVRALRRASGRGLRVAARELGVDAGHLSRIENGFVASPAIALVRKLATMYRAPLCELTRRIPGGAEVEVALTDDGAGAACAQFYRLAAGRTTEEQRRMLAAALDALGLPPDEHVAWVELLR